MWMVYITILVSYILGSIPTGYLLVKKLYGIDIRTKGSGNIGSTNVKRVAGTRASLITQALDILKGAIPMLAAIYITNRYRLPINKDLFLSLVALAAVIGHNYTIFLNFNGGKGVNTTLGAFIFLAPIPVVVGIILHLGLRKVLPVVAVRSIILGLAIAITAVILGLSKPIVYACLVSAIIMIVRHKKNIIELLGKNKKS